MKKLLFFLLICTNAWSTQTILISDIDDTIKITAVKEPRIAGYALRDEEFSGMSNLYSFFLCDEKIPCLDKNVIYVTGAPGKVSVLGAKFLKKNKFPNQENILWRDTKQSTLDFKKQIIEKFIVGNLKSFKYILVGDNGEFDPQVYQYIKNKFPERVLGTFIHSIYLPKGQERKLFEGQLAYLTSVDLAVHFYNMGQIAGDKLQKLIDMGLLEVRKKENNVLKSWFACKYFQHMNFFPQIKGNSASLEGFKRELFASKKCQ